MKLLNLTPLFIAGMLTTCGAPAPALAQTVVGVHIGSVHSNKIDAVSGKEWNNTNPGLYVRHGDYVVGTYYNSIRRQSVYLGYTYQLHPNVDVVMGAVSGYDGPGYRAKAIMPMVIPSFHFPITNTINARLNLAIGVGRGSATAINFALEYKL